jgi:DNA-binding GntR family transcriptional regulator
MLTELGGKVDPSGDGRTKQTQAEYAYAELRRLILTTQLKPGAAIKEADLLERLKVIGRTPLRDALHRLSHDGLVRIGARRGTTVAQLTFDDLRQIFELRVAFEGLIAQGAVRHGTEADVAQFRALVDAAVANRDPELIVEIDGRFHELLVQMADNRFLSEFYRKLRDASLRLLYLTECRMESRIEQINTLREILNALEVGDAERLDMILVRHVEDFRDRTQQALFGRRERSSSLNEAIAEHHE